MKMGLAKDQPRDGGPVHSAQPRLLPVGDDGLEHPIVP